MNLGGAVSLLFVAFSYVTSMRLFYGRYYDHLCTAWISFMVVATQVSVNITGGDRLTGCQFEAATTCI